jgi:UV DNA damage endonuclease
MNLRLGFPVIILGEEGIKSNDTRRWQSSPHLKVSLEYLHKVFDYLQKHKISMYRMSSDLAPYATHPDMPQFHNQVQESRQELEDIGKRARELNLRLSFHPSQFVILNSPDPELCKKGIWDLTVQAEMLDTMGLGPDAVLVIHVGGSYGDNRSGIDRWCATWDNLLPESVKRRLVLENDDIRYSAADVLTIHERTGVRLIFDVQHFWCLNPQCLELKSALRSFLKTWPDGVRPKIHYSSPRTEMREVKRKDRKTGKKKTALLPPVWTGHADFVQPFEFISFFRDNPDMETDVMLEAKSKDLALLRLRQDLARYAPDVAKRFGISVSEELSEPPLEEIAVDAAQLAAAS